MKSLKNAAGYSLLTRYTDLNLNFFVEEASALDPHTKNKSCISKKTWDRIEDKMSILNVTDITVKSEISHRDESDDIPPTYADPSALPVE